jgi:hypothetical protein
VEVYRCNCGANQCHDCYMGAMYRTSGMWRNCTRCASMMCSKEWEAKGAACTDCGAEPLCKPCRAAHDKECAGPPPGTDSDDDSD